MQLHKTPNIYVTNISNFKLIFWFYHIPVGCEEYRILNPVFPLVLL